MNDTAILWTEKTWNPCSGCQKVSAGCKYCYAERLAEQRRGTRAFPVGFDLQLRPHKLVEPTKLKRPSRIFVNSMSDLFWPAIPEDFRARVFAAMDAAPWHRYEVLTKRPEVAAEWFGRRPVPGHIWLGVTIERQDFAWRIETLQTIHAAHRFVSAEPLLGPLELDLSGIEWLIVGGESGPHLGDPEICRARGLVERGSGPLRWLPRQDRVHWVRSLRDQALAQGTDFFFKQWGGARPESGGRDLDGRTWDQIAEGSDSQNSSQRLRITSQ